MSIFSQETMKHTSLEDSTCQGHEIERRKQGVGENGDFTQRCGYIA